MGIVGAALKRPVTTLAAVGLTFRQIEAVAPSGYGLMSPWPPFHHYAERPHRGYRNMGRRPIVTVNLFQETAKKEG